jgi:Domain of unknown function (DUF4296)
MRRIALFLLVTATLIGCGEKEQSRQDIMPKAKMEKIIWDLVQADEFVQSFVLKDSNMVKVNQERYKLYEQVFRLHNTTKEQFKKSFDYYAARPTEGKIIFDSLSAKGNRRMQDVYKPVE